MLGRLFKRRLLPAAHRPAFAENERVLAWALTQAGSAVIATNLRLWVAGTGTPWNEVSKAKWDGSELTVITSSVVAQREGYAVIEDNPPVRIELVDPEHLPHQIRLRVTSSVKNPSHHGLPGGGGVWIAARRAPGVDGLSWIARYDTGTDRDDPRVVAATDDIFKETYWRVVAPDE
ncbi:hypothetical protein Rhe02_13080 [Rhizocola hellebori]|uniref:Uncharacterized protein n=1 Tax=Rhizocola hellebori TaxID=1392758 RepID=A0A8J3Q3Z2_9ACTN|nr:hypothetical protein [Rhizocola hellebori]GIH03241.1 hypothetical protein Rhe02_13080 [Rhizocola hellebori]